MAGNFQKSNGKQNERVFFIEILKHNCRKCVIDGKLLGFVRQTGGQKIFSRPRTEIVSEQYLMELGYSSIIL